MADIDDVIRKVLTTSGLSTTKTTQAPSTRKKSRSSSVTPSPKWTTPVNSPRLTSNNVSRILKWTAQAPSRRTRWLSTSRKSLASEQRSSSSGATLINRNLQMDLKLCSFEEGFYSSLHGRRYYSISLLWKLLLKSVSLFMFRSSFFSNKSFNL